MYKNLAILSMSNYIQKFNENINSSIKIDALVQLLGISEKQISKTDYDTYDTYTKYGEETFKVFSRDDIEGYTYDEYMKNIDIYLDYSDGNELFFFNYAIHSINLNIKKFFYDYTKFCEDEYNIYSDKLNTPDGILDIISDNKSTKDLAEYVELLKKGDYNFIIKHVLWLIKYEYNDIDERITFVKSIINLDELKKYIITSNMILVIMHMSRIFSNVYFLKLNNNLYHKFLIIKV